MRRPAACCNVVTRRLLDDGGMSRVRYRLRALVVEDDPDLRLMLEHHLDGAGYEVRMAVSTRDAVVACDEFDPDLVILDLTLPDGSGLDVCRHIRRSSKP